MIFFSSLAGALIRLSAFPLSGRVAGALLLVHMPWHMACAEDGFKELATSLTENIQGEVVNIAVGNFAYENTMLLSPFSSLLRDELELALNDTKKFKVVTRDRLADLQKEGKFQGKSILEPGTGVEKVSIEGVKGIVRGRFYVADDQITVFAELAWLEGGNIKKARVEIPSSKVKAKVWPDVQDAATKNVSKYLQPQNVEQSLANVQDIVSSRLEKISKDFQVEIFTTDGRRAYPAGDNISFNVRSAKKCHIAVLCHQSDGTTVVLFPNKFSESTLIPANKVINVPGTHKHGFEIEIGPPFGSDVVEVIACTKDTELHKTLSRHAAKAATYHVQTRGMIVKGIDNALGSTQAAAGVPLLWSQDSVVVSTFPKP